LWPNGGLHLTGEETVKQTGRWTARGPVWAHDDSPLTDVERQVTGIDRQKTSTARQQTDNARTAAFLVTDQTKETSCRLHERMSLYGRHVRPAAHTSSPLQMVQDLYNADLTCHQTIENNMSQMQRYHDRPHA